jgi:hypothetical protein
MLQETRIDNLLGTMMKRFRLSWYWATVCVALALLLLFFAATYLDGRLPVLLERGAWQKPAVALIHLCYILILYPVIWRLRERAIQVFRPLVDLDDEAFGHLAKEISVPSRRWEWTAVLSGLGVALALGQPWNLAWESGGLWTSVYMTIYSAVYSGLLYWLIYDTLASTIQHARLSRQPLKLDILETNRLDPVARWSLGISLMFVGGISLSLINQTWEDLLNWRSLFTYSMLIVVTVLVFFLSMWGVHKAIADIKNSELALAQKHLIEASRELKARAAKGPLERAEGLSSTISMWETYQRLVKGVPTWPYNPAMILRLATSFLVPAAVYFIKILLGLGFPF